MNFDKRYWLLIAAAMACATTASACTLYMKAVYGHFIECNSVSAACFERIGMVPSMVLGILALLPLMVAIPYLFRENARPGLVSVLILLCIVAYTAFDATNDVSAIMGFQHPYVVAHTLLSATNNIAGTVIGTGTSAC